MVHAVYRRKLPPSNPLAREETIRAFLVSLLGAATLTAGVVLIRLRRQARVGATLSPVTGGITSRTVSIDRLRELGL
jgi:hypothetical protein